jgi:hypothetical protein
MSRSELLFLPQQMAWYVLVGFAMIGVVEGCRRDALATWLFIGMSTAGAAVIALNEGNIGTMVRHRDSIVPFVACLGAIGATALLARFAPCVAGDPDIDARVVTGIVETSRIVEALRRSFDLLREAWRGSALATACSPIHALERWQRCRLLGWTLFVGVVGGTGIAMAGHAAWPSALVGLVPLTLALLLITKPLAIVIALQERHRV